MKRLAAFALLYFCYGNPARAEPDRPFYLGLGLFFQNVTRVSSSPTAAPSLLGEAYFPELLLGYRLPRLFPTFGWTVLGKAANDGQMRRSLMRLDLPYLFPAGPDQVQAKAGLGFLFQRLHGPASVESLRNGPIVSDFYVPGGTRSSRLLYLSGGAAFGRGRWRFDLDLLATGLLSSRRAFHLSLRSGYAF
jgi:hypothetical protein